MLTLPPGVKLFAFTEPVDARKSFDAKLATHTQQGLLPERNRSVGYVGSPLCSAPHAGH